MNTLVDLVQTHGLWLVFLITLLQSVGLPLPAFAVLIVTTAVTPPTASNIIALVLIGSLGTLMGDLVLYFAGKKYGTGILGKLCKISISPDSCVRNTGDVFDRYGAPALTIVKFIPGLSTLAPVVAGVYEMKLALFIFFSSIAALIYVGAAATLGAIFRHQVDGLIAAISHYGMMGGYLLFYYSAYTFCSNGSGAIALSGSLKQIK